MAGLDRLEADDETTARIQVELPFTSKGSILRSCYECAAEPSVVFDVDQITVEANHVPEEYFSVVIPVPSGRLLMDDDLRETYEELPYDRVDAPDVNHTKGVRLCSENYARQGMMHFFVGNSCPGIRKLKPGLIEAGHFAEDAPDQGEGVGSICTDLWWFSAVDYDLFKERLLREEDTTSEKVEKYLKHVEKMGALVEVTPGDYRCTSYFHIDSYQDEEGKDQVYLRMERVQ
jgi:hypothetical protein